MWNLTYPSNFYRTVQIGEDTYQRGIGGTIAVEHSIQKGEYSVANEAEKRIPKTLILNFDPKTISLAQQTLLHQLIENGVEVYFLTHDNLCLLTHDNIAEIRKRWKQDKSNETLITQGMQQLKKSHDELMVVSDSDLSEFARLNSQKIPTIYYASDLVNLEPKEQADVLQQLQKNGGQLVLTKLDQDIQDILNIISLQTIGKKSIVLNHIHSVQLTPGMIEKSNAIKEYLNDVSPLTPAELQRSESEQGLTSPSTASTVSPIDTQQTQGEKPLVIEQNIGRESVSDILKKIIGEILDATNKPENIQLTLYKIREFFLQITSFIMKKKHGVSLDDMLPIIFELINQYFAQLNENQKKNIENAANFFLQSESFNQIGQCTQSLTTPILGILANYSNLKSNPISDQNQQTPRIKIDTSKILLDWKLAENSIKKIIELASTDVDISDFLENSITAETFVIRNRVSPSVIQTHLNAITRALNSGQSDEAFYQFARFGKFFHESFHENIDKEQYNADDAISFLKTHYPELRVTGFTNKTIEQGAIVREVVETIRQNIVTAVQNVQLKKSFLLIASQTLLGSKLFESITCELVDSSKTIEEVFADYMRSHPDKIDSATENCVQKFNKNKIVERVAYSLTKKSDTIEVEEKEEDIQQLRLALKEYIKQTSGVIGFLTTWQSTKSLEVFEQLAKIADGEPHRLSIQQILDETKLDSTKSRLGRVLQKYNVIPKTHSDYDSHTTTNTLKRGCYR